jgi:predicted nicotinamide N-methyase
MAPTADVLANLREKDPSRKFGAIPQAALLACLRHPITVEHPPGRPYRERLLKNAALAAERDGIVLHDGLAEAYAEALCESANTRAVDDLWCHKTFILDARVDDRDGNPEDPYTIAKLPANLSGASGRAPPPTRPLRITVRTHPNLFRGGTGCHEWAAGFRLAELVVSNPSFFSNKKIAEIGSGVGVSALALCAALREPPRDVHLLDRDPETLQNLTENLAVNGVLSRNDAEGDEENAAENTKVPKFPKVRVRRLDWTDFHGETLARLNVDVVVAADVLYDPLDIPGVLDVTRALLGVRSDAKPSNSSFIENEPRALFVSAVRQPGTLRTFVERATDQGFEPIDVTESFVTEPTVGFRRLIAEHRTEIRVHALRPPVATKGREG